MTGYRNDGCSALSTIATVLMRLRLALGAAERVAITAMLEMPEAKRVSGTA